MFNFKIINYLFRGKYNRSIFYVNLENLLTL